MNIVKLPEHIMKIKESEMINEYLDLARYLEELRNTGVNVVLFVVGVLETVPTSMDKELKEQKISRKIKTLQITAWLRSAKILRRVLEN